MEKIRSRLEKYIKLTEKALKKVNKKKIRSKGAKKLIELANCYYQDALYFKQKKDYLNAFAAINYAHAFLDSAAILGLIRIKDNKLLMSD
ncbi:MAG: DUF357 domain-containing protein [Nanoarchaeota archaeon]